MSVLKSGGTTQTFAYDARGNMTGDAQTGAAVTAYTYDLGNRLTGIDAGGSATANDATFTFDALGRFATRVLVGPATTDTYGYVGVSETVARIANSGGLTTDSIVSATGDRIGVKVGSTVNWLLPDLHGNTGASLSADEAAVTNAIRYDAYGMTLATGNGAGAPNPVGDKAWRYQGRLDISPEGLATPLYDMGARFYAPGIGAFTQADSVMGSAQDPLSMNRFLYAQGNPATLIDPTGHAACSAYADTCTTNGSSRVTVQNTARHTGRRTARQVYADYYRHRRSQARYGEGGRYDAKRTSPLVAKATSKRMAADASAADDRESAARSSATRTYGSTPPGTLSTRAQFKAELDNWEKTGCFRSCLTWADVPVIGAYMQEGADRWEASHPAGSTAIGIVFVGPAAVKGSASTLSPFVSVDETIASGSSSFRALKRDVGPLDGKVLDHVVEQSQILRSGFPKELINSRENAIPVHPNFNQLKADFYSTKQPFSAPGTVRDWLSGQSFEAQLKFGLDYLRELMGGRR